MGFSREIYRIAAEKLQSRRKAALDGAAERKAAFVLRVPVYARLERELSRTGISLVRVIFDTGAGGGAKSGGSDNIRAKVGEIGVLNMEIQNEMRRLLEAEGLDEDYLEPKWHCALCSDTGLEDGKTCDCMRSLMRRIAYERLNATTPLSISTFDSFSLAGYSNLAETSKGLSPRHMMEVTYKKCREYARDFSMASRSLLFQGGVGLGKTHLSLAIAGEVIEKGYDVVYGTAQEFFNRIEREKFGRAPSDDDTLARLCEVDLLIIDDLGAEFSTPFTASVLHELINTRLLGSRPTIISTNLNLDGMESRYDRRIVSRIHGSYSRWQFVGKDMRIVLRRATRVGED
ncbi:MAG: ATP-binding protein [Oscillospiraceae bacterium]|nr:ATP-binding protein [Oscillospiraceae bacterium]